MKWLEELRVFKSVWNSDQEIIKIKVDWLELALAVVITMWAYKELFK